MPQGSSFRLIAGIAFGLAATTTASFAQSTGTPAQQEPAVANDPYQWLEDVKGDKSIAWVREQNAKSEAELAQSPQFRKLETDIRAILDSTAKIPGVEKIGDYYYNFWKDKDHARGLWRRTTLDEYRKADPKWETILDLDALNAAEKENWVWHGADCLKPDYTRCLIALSRGGSDADVTREFDLSTKAWVKDGFYRPEAKGGLSWIDKDAVYVYTDFGAGSMTPSGYPRIVKQWQRGTPMAQAQKVYEGQAQDMYIAAARDHTPGFQRDFVYRTIAFYNDELFLRGSDGKLAKVDAPNSANKSVHKDWLLLELRDPYDAGGKTYPAGALIATNFDDFMAGKRDFTVLFAPTDNTSLASFGWTKNHLVLNVMEDVKNKLFVLTPAAQGEWTRKPLAGAPTIGTVSVAPVDGDDNDNVWVTATDYLTPTTLAIADVSNDAAPETLKSNPQFFDASKHVIEQHFATSKDGTKIPYFLVKPKDAKNDGTTPTLLYGYGGFEVSMTPAYSGGVGKGWLEKGGAYAVANIRGGGEYGPRWHQAALKANRHKAYEDFAAVANDLVASKLTTHQRLGIMGGSNGGLLMGNMLTLYPQLYGAIVSQVPLLDMKRYTHLSAGASWMAEYGDPDKPAEWAWIRTFSPYQNVAPGKHYPPVLFTTSTRDDRVGPAHARKMAAKMQAMGYRADFYENIEGGHGGAADNKQSAFMHALEYTWLWQHVK
jgi:prolyl oligopeptidase